LNVSPWNPSERDIGLCLTLLALAFIPLRYWRYRRLASELFAGREGDDTALQEMRQKLDVVNSECPTHMFSATRMATVYLHENPISLVYGYVVPLVGRGGTEKHVFALAGQDQADWMRLYSDVFEPAFSGSPWSIFWVKVPALVRLIRRGAAFTLTVNGSNFVSGSVVDWNGSPRSTTFSSRTKLTASISMADIATQGTASVTVVNAAPGGGTSNAKTFTTHPSHRLRPSVSRDAKSHGRCLPLEDG
jgi:hypothetical protein